jgi:hypothetical protein
MTAWRPTERPPRRQSHGGEEAHALHTGRAAPLRCPGLCTRPRGRLYTWRRVDRAWSGHAKLAKRLVRLENLGLKVYRRAGCVSGNVAGSC